MSATGRGVDRIEADWYPTPRWAVHRLFEKCPLPSGVLYEPFAGDGSIIRAVNEVAPAPPLWLAAELREEARAPLTALLDPRRVHIGDSINAYLFPEHDEVSIITNPPFSMAAECLMMAMSRAKFVAFLLRLNFLGSDERAEIWEEFPPDVYVLPNRPCFHVFVKDHYYCEGCKKGVSIEEEDNVGFLLCAKCGVPCTYKGKRKTTSDATEYAWFVYQEGVERRREKGNWCVLKSTPAEVRAAAIQELLGQRQLVA